MIEERVAGADEALAEQARAFLSARGVRGVTIRGSGEDWTVAIGWNEPERFVVAYSAKNPATPNDPVYLASQALATLIRNEGPCPHVSQGTCDEVSQLELGAELLADAGDEEQDSGYAEAPELHADHSEDAGSAGGAGSDFGGDHALPGDSGPGVDAAADEPLQAELADDREPDGAPSVAIFGPEPDKLPLLKLFKHGQLSQAARVRRAAVLGNWTMDEFHSQQAQLSRFARGELVAGPEAQAHFEMVAERIAAVEAVSRYAEGRAMTLDMLATREAVDAFDPSEGLT